MSSPGYSENADLLIQPVLITITVAHIPKQHLNITTYAEGPTSVGEQAGERDFEAAMPKGNITTVATIGHLCEPAIVLWQEQQSEYQRE